MWVKTINQDEIVNCETGVIIEKWLNPYSEKCRYNIVCEKQTGRGAIIFQTDRLDVLREHWAKLLEKLNVYEV